MLAFRDLFQARPFHGLVLMLKFDIGKDFSSLSSMKITTHKSYRLIPFKAKSSKCFVLKDSHLDNRRKHGSGTFGRPVAAENKNFDDPLFPMICMPLICCRRLCSYNVLTYTVTSRPMAAV
ncbi:hypothetical protein AVEN_236237-1 [Araneus ventricosus]|uniref:Uncharacterized protein n=1 Tax=Araneus ventricosus TaxID=182803 RepID=A0A4Y2CAF5_ARAVE|nr:hypothetical protein AVEN_236237-1 [Araneus ventricosus]